MLVFVIFSVFSGQICSRVKVTYVTDYCCGTPVSSASVKTHWSWGGSWPSGRRTPPSEASAPGTGRWPPAACRRSPWCPPRTGPPPCRWHRRGRGINHFINATIIWWRVNTGVCHVLLLSNFLTVALYLFMLIHCELLYRGIDLHPHASRIHPSF